MNNNIFSSERGGYVIIDYKLIGERIKEARGIKNVTQEKLAELVDVSVAYISKVERGGQINLKKLAQISLVLEASMEFLVTGIVAEDKSHLNRELYDILINCTPEKQRLIYNMARIVLDTEFD